MAKFGCETGSGRGGSSRLGSWRVVGETAPEDGVRLCDSPPGTQATGLVLFNLSLLLSKEAGSVTYNLYPSLVTLVCLHSGHTADFQTMKGWLEPQPSGVYKFDLTWPKLGIFGTSHVCSFLCHFLFLSEFKQGEIDHCFN